MIFVSIMFLIPFLSPTCVNVLVAFLVWVVVPKLISLAVLDGSVFPASVALPRGLNEACVNNLASLKLRPFASSNWKEVVKQGVKHTDLDQFILTCPHRLFVRYVTYRMYV